MPKHIMLSYQWDHQVLVRRVYERLRDHGLPVWMDVEGGVTGDINDSMAAGVEEALVICPFMTPAYQGSRSCKKELTYADSREVVVVPVMLVSEWAASEWLGLITAGLLWLDFSDADQDEEQFDLSVRSLKDEILFNVGHLLEVKGQARNHRRFCHAHSNTYIHDSDEQVTGARVQPTALLGDRCYWEELKGRGCKLYRNAVTRRFLGLEREEGGVCSQESPSEMEEWLLLEARTHGTRRRAVALKHKLSGRFLALQDGVFVGLSSCTDDCTWLLE